MTREPLSTSSSDVTPIAHRPQMVDPAQAGRPGGPHAYGVPLACLLAIVLVLVFEIGFVYQFRYRFWDSTYSLAEIKRKLLVSDAPADDVAIFGNSRFYHLDPDNLKAVFGEDARITNYAWAWCGMEIYEPMLRGLIDSGRKPTLLIVDANAEMFGYDESLLTTAGDPSNQFRYRQTAPFWQGLRFQLAQEQWGPAWDTFSSKMVPPSVLYGERVPRELRRFLKDQKLPKPRQDFDRMVGHWQEHGWFQYAPERISEWAEYVHAESTNGPYKLMENGKYLAVYEKFLSLAQRHGVTVVMLPVPHNELQYDAYIENGVYAAYDAWLNEMQAKYPVFHAPAPRWQKWGGMLADAGHLNQAGIERHWELSNEMLNGLKAEGKLPQELVSGGGDNVTPQAERE